MFKSPLLYFGLICIASIQVTQADTLQSKPNDRTLTSEQQQQLLIDARLKTQSFAKQLKNTLKKSITQNGFEAAIDACQLQAPLIAQQQSLTDWKVKRTSLKVRNPNNQADSWEHNTLLEFEERILSGETIKTIETLELVEGQLRYMKAIPTQQLCTACHGTAITPDLRATLTQRYPLDQATGFELGQLRGAFSLTTTPYKTK